MMRNRPLAMLGAALALLIGGVALWQISDSSKPSDAEPRQNELAIQPGASVRLGKVTRFEELLTDGKIAERAMVSLGLDAGQRDLVDRALADLEVALGQERAAHWKPVEESIVGPRFYEGEHGGFFVLADFKDRADAIVAKALEGLRPRLHKAQVERLGEIVRISDLGNIGMTRVDVMFEHLDDGTTRCHYLEIDQSDGYLAGRGTLTIQELNQRYGVGFKLQ